MTRSVAAGTGILLPTGRAQWGPGDAARRLLDLARCGEDAGADSLWTNDSLLLPRLEPLALLSALAPVTRHVRLGTAALLPAFRDPVQSAQAVATVDHLTEGRLVVTVGAGFPNRSEREYAPAGTPWPRRFTRLDDTAALWRQLWRGSGEDTFDGAVLRVRDLPPGTPSYRPDGPPIWLGGVTPAALARTGRIYDGWLPHLPVSADYAGGLAAVQAAAVGAGRDPDALTPALFLTVLVVPDPETGRAAIDAFCRDDYGHPFDVVRTVQAFAVGTGADVAQRVAEYRAAGARHLVLRIATADMDGWVTQVGALAQAGALGAVERDVR